jgi:hypothetical protein
MTTLRLTYEELAERTGRSPEGARMLARRRHWRIERSNDGKARVILDEGELVDRPTRRPPGHSLDDRPPDHPTAQDDGELAFELRARIQALEVEHEALTEARDHLVEQLGEARERAARFEGKAETLERALADLAARLDRAEALLARPWWRRLIG